MAVTLANVRAGMQDALSAQVIDEFCKSSYLRGRAPAEHDG